MIPDIVMRSTALAFRYLQAYAPSNLIVASIRQKRAGTRSACGLLLLSASCFVAAICISRAAQRDGLGLLHLAVLIFTWNALKFGWTAAMCPIWARTHRHRFTQAQGRPSRTDETEHRWLHPRSHLARPIPGTRTCV